MRPVSGVSAFERQPRPWLRAAGAMYLAVIALGLFGEVSVRGTLVAAGDLLMHLPDLPLALGVLLAPSVAAALFPAVLVPAFVGKLSLALWLLVKGVRQDAWHRAVAAWHDRTS